MSLVIDEAYHFRRLDNFFSTFERQDWSALRGFERLYCTECVLFGDKYDAHFCKRIINRIREHEEYIGSDGDKGEDRSKKELTNYMSDTLSLMTKVRFSDGIKKACFEGL